MKETLKEIRGQKKRLEVHLDKLLQSPFVKQHEESKKNQQRFMDLTQQKEDLEKKRAGLISQLKQLKIDEQRTFNKLDENQKVIQQQKDEIEKREKKYEEQENMYGTFRDMDTGGDNFNKILGKIYINGQVPHWKTLDYIQSGGIDYDDIASLQKAVENL